MAYFCTENKIISQPIGSTSATIAPDLALGTVVRAKDPTYGEATFIYLLGVASTIAGSLVTYDGATAGVPTYQTVLAPATANLAKPLAVAMSANVAGQFGWYQTSGTMVVATNGTLAAAAVKVFLAGSGQITGTAGAGLQVLNAISASATGTPAANQALVTAGIQPFAQGQIT